MVNTNAWNRFRYTLWAPIYDRVAGFPYYRRRSIEMLHSTPGDQILIVGAGTGADLPHLPPDLLVTAIDLTPAMLERLRRRAAALGRLVDVRVMDGHALAFPANSFDAVILHLILAVIPDPVACIREAERVVKPGGRVAVFDKFLPDGERPSAGRRLGNILTNLLFTDITRQLGPLVAQTSLTVERRESYAMPGFQFQIAVLRKR